MTSWREGVSDQAQHDLEELNAALLGFAENQLNKRGEFFAFGANISAESGEVQTFMLEADGDRPDAGAYLAATWEALEKDHDDLRAVGIASDVRIEGGQDAVRVELEHVEHVALQIVTPYRMVRSGGLHKRVAFAEPSVSDTVSRLWR